MGVFDELSKILKPHSDRLNENLATQGNLIHDRLSRIESVLKLTPTSVDYWRRLRINQKMAEGEKIELAVVPNNEIWILESLVTDGVFVKAPAYIIEVNNQLVSSVIAEGVGTEKIGGDVVALPGEVLTLTARKEGTVSFCLHLIRRRLPATEKKAQMGPSGHHLASSNTHDPQRDVIESRTGEYAELGHEVIDTTGRPPLVR
jgi:hypothetical protein